LPMLFGEGEYKAMEKMRDAGRYILINETDNEALTFENRIGIAWEGNPNQTENDLRSCPLKYFKRLNGSLFSLQHKMYLDHLRKDCEDMELLSIKINDFYDVAVLINSVERVVTVDTGVMHLAGAMGAKTDGLIHFTCDPRWRKDSKRVWYPSVKFHHQDAQDDWESVFRTVP